MIQLGWMSPSMIAVVIDDRGFSGGDMERPG